MTQPTTPVIVCPCCGEQLEAHSPLNKRTASPQPGHFSVCLTCVSVNVFELHPQTGELRLRQATEEDMRTLGIKETVLINLTRGFIKSNQHQQ